MLLMNAGSAVREASIGDEEVDNRDSESEPGDDDKGASLPPVAHNSNHARQVSMAASMQPANHGGGEDSSGSEERLATGSKRKGGQKEKKKKKRGGKETEAEREDRERARFKPPKRTHRG